MNSQILTSNTTPLFEKRTVAELSEIEMMQVDGGTTTVCLAIGASSEACAAFVAIALVHLIDGKW